MPRLFHARCNNGTVVHVKRFWTVLAFGSLIVALSAAALWVRGCFAQDEWRWTWTTPYPDLFTAGDSFHTHDMLYLTAGKGGLAIGKRAQWNDPFEPTSRVELWSFDHDRYPAAYPISPPGNAPANGFQSTFVGFQFRRETFDELNPIFHPGIKLDDHNGIFVAPKPRRSTILHESTITFPLWAVILVFGLPFGVWQQNQRRRALRALRLGNRLCAECGYDLRSSANKCPECGVSPAAHS